MNSKLERCRKNIFLLLLIPLFILVQSCASLMEGDKRTEILTKRIGYHVHTEAKRNFVLVNDPFITGRLRELAQKIFSRADLNWEVTDFYVINSPGVNVFATPDGALFMTSRFLDILDTPDELAYVIARTMVLTKLGDDMAHIVSEKLSDSPGATMMIFLSDTFNFAAALSLTVTTGTPTQLLTEPEQETQLEQVGSVPVSYAFPYIVNQEYDVELQLKADRKGALIAEKAGYDISGSVSVLEKCEDFRQSSHVAVEKLSPFIDVKPELKIRIDMLREFLSQR